jgi:hypothetical protein
MYSSWHSSNRYLPFDLGELISRVSLRLVIKSAGIGGMTGFCMSSMSVFEGSSHQSMFSRLDTGQPHTCLPWIGFISSFARNQVPA